MLRMRMVVAGFVLLSVLTPQAQDPGLFSHTQSDTVLKPGPVFLPEPTADLWSHYNLTGIPDTLQLSDTITQPLPSPALTDSMLWSHLYQDDFLEESPLTIVGTGDIMLGTSYPNESYLPPGQDCSPILRPVHQVLQSGDLLFGNLEGVFCSEGGTPKNCKNPATCYVFRMPDHFLSCILKAGYDVLSVANNHVNDFGPAGRASTAALLDSAGVAYAGFVTHPWTIFEKGGVTYGFAAFAPNRGTMDLKDYHRAAEITTMLDSLADVVIISVHGGAEGKDHQHVVRGDEEYLGANRGNIYHFAHTVVDAGADVVFGHGPHVTRAVELYRNRLICYSLGNFATYRRFNLSGPNGIAPIVKVQVDREGGFLQGEVISIYQPGEGGPRIDPAGRATAKLKALTEFDFPDQELVVDSDGILWTR
ncbi:MAG: CapA family protein [Bacteroidales bacterium]|nr:CapA family protein [Bacteroidales bacterium]